MKIYPPPKKEYKADSVLQWEYTKTLGFQKLKKIANDTSLRQFSIERNIDYVSLYLITTEKRKPSFQKIRQLKHDILPSDWVYYDE